MSSARIFSSQSKLVRIFKFQVLSRSECEAVSVEWENAIIIYSLYSSIDYTERGMTPAQWATFVDFNPFAFRSHMAQHLIRLVKADSNMSNKDMQTHHFFWDVQTLLLFEHRLQTFSSKYQGFDRILEKGKRYVFEGKWSSRLTPHIADACVSPKNQSKLNENSFMGLAMARRNRCQHRDEDEPHIQADMGTIPRKNFMFWEQLFPRFTHYLLINSLSFYNRNETQLLYVNLEFSEFFTGSRAFYEACVAIGL